MKLPISQLFAKKEKQAYLLGVLLYDERIKVIIFSQNSTSLQIITHHEELLPALLDEITLEQLTDVFDKAIGVAENKLPENADLKQTIFGVKQEWTQDKKIKKEYLLKLKKISEDLDLEPIGFIVFTESLIHLLEQEQGVPVSGILVEVGKRSLTTSVLRASKIVESREGPITHSVASTVDQLLQQIITVEILPSKLLVSVDASDRELEKQFEQHSWTKTLPFLHDPQIHILPSNFDLKAIAAGTATQLGLTLNDVELSAEPLPETTKKESQFESEEETTKEDAFDVKDTPPEEHLESPDRFGFVQNRDIDSIPPPTISELSSPHILKEEVFTHQPRKEQLLALKEKLSSIKTVFSMITRLKEPLSALPGKFVLLIIPGIILIFILLFIFYTMNVKGIISIALTPTPISEEKAITIAPKADTNYAKNIIHGSVVQVSEDGSLSTPATGKKDIGDKAKGSVTFFNSDSQSHTLSSGTTITSDGNVVFTLDASVTVASASGDIFTGTTPGTVDGTVTASSIGTDGNLASGTKFTVAGIPSVAAKNNKAFTGGSKKSVIVVSDQDIQKLTNDLPNQLQQKGKDDLSHQTRDGVTVLPNITNTTITKKTFSKKSGDEAPSVSIEGTVTYQSISYDKTDVTNFAQFVLKDKVTDKTKLAQNSLKVTITTSTLDKKQNAQATASIQALTLPILDVSTIALSLREKSFTQAQTILQQLPQFQSADISLSPNIFFLPKNLPGNEKHISVTVRTQ